jgi:DNA-binding transcriptional LysR family regulator
MNVESRPLRYFVAVAEELSFARAAERLAIASPALSKAMNQLEAQLGVQLLERTTRRVALTPAGAVLLDEARVALDALDAAARRARRAGEPDPALVLALKSDLDGGLLEPLLAAYAGPVEVALCGWDEQAALLRDGRADVALLTLPCDDRGLDTELLVEEPSRVAIAAAHPLARRDQISLRDLDDDHERVPGRNLWLPKGRGPTAITDLAALMRLVELGALVALLPVSVTDRYARPGLVYLPAGDAPPTRFAVAWPSASRSLATAAFVRAAVDVALTLPVSM